MLLSYKNDLRRLLEVLIRLLATQVCGGSSPLSACRAIIICLADLSLQMNLELGDISSINCGRVSHLFLATDGSGSTRGRLDIDELAIVSRPALLLDLREIWSTFLLNVALTGSASFNASYERLALRKGRLVVLVMHELALAYGTGYTCTISTRKVISRRFLLQILLLNL